MLQPLYEKFNNIFSGIFPSISFFSQSSSSSRRYQGYLGAYLIIVGVDVTGSHIATVHPHGSTAFLPFVASGSGGYTSLSVIEDRYKENMTVIDILIPIEDFVFLCF